MVVDVFFLGLLPWTKLYLDRVCGFRVCNFLNEYADEIYSKVGEESQHRTKAPMMTKVKKNKEKLNITVLIQYYESTITIRKRSLLVTKTPGLSSRHRKQWSM